MYVVNGLYRIRNGEQRSVIVIGGGVSGLAAASKLVQDGRFAVTLLEASDRIGGRVFTEEFGKPCLICIQQ